MKRKLFSFLLIAALLFGLSAQTLAADVDPNAKGSITLEMTWLGRPVSGGTLTCYRVGDLTWKNGEYVFVPAGDFAEWDGEFDNIQSPELALSLAAYAERNGIQGTTKSIGANGRVTFDDLAPGLYLMVQEEAAEGFYPVNPFLVSIPQEENGKLEYDIDASPKVEPIPEPTWPTCPSEPTEPSEPTGPTEPTTPTEPTGPSEPTEPTGPSEPTEPSSPTEPDNPSEPTGPSGPTEPTQPSVPEESTEPSGPSESTEPEETTGPSEPTEPDVPRLPQTGQLNWPIPVMAVLGMGLFAYGWALCFRRKDGGSEK